ncbi:MAG: maleylpyruvate isomerase family mycothiol-dependent enzyme [Actinomycetota bacterium]|nr:maleylpyruvate isomerase family mycothiol-dependent enzyme [Actinomycetota bacterium]
MTTPTDANLTSDDYRAKAERVQRVADTAATSAAWDNDSPCAGWAARDVIRHMIDTQRDFLSRHELALPPPPEATAAPDPAAEWRTHAAGVCGLLADPQVGPREYDGHFGRTSIGATMARFYGWDMLVHRWDLARALGADDTLTTEELDEIEGSAQGFDDQLYAEGICRPALPVAQDADRQVRVLARLGRDGRS